MVLALATTDVVSGELYSVQRYVERLSVNADMQLRPMSRKKPADSVFVSLLLVSVLSASNMHRYHR